MVAEMPTIFNNTSVSNCYSPDTFTYTDSTFSTAYYKDVEPRDKNGNLIVKMEKIEMANKRRIVAVFIIDGDENLPLDKAIIHEGEEKLTDATDQELFFEVNINELLTAHNAERQKIINKKESVKKEKDVYLEPIRIRDLKMVVNTILEF